MVLYYRYCIILYYIVLYCIVLYCIILYYIVLYCIILYCIILYCIVLYCIILYCIVLYYIVLYCIVLYYIISYPIMLYYVVLYYIMLCFVMAIFCATAPSPPIPPLKLTNSIHKIIRLVVGAFYRKPSIYPSNMGVHFPSSNTGTKTLINYINLSTRSISLYQFTVC